ncbi:MAG: 5-formyltetrahydrofolate cyclo-ligase [Actinobacteria bacterium]|nr:5-formyltetrahydrofolate cyclo-ligase [Actinomycetota bacterium]
MDELGTSSVGDKAALRAQIRTERRLRTPADRQAAGIAIASNARGLPLPGHLSGVTIACYLSLETEPGTGPLIEDLLTRGASVLVPRVAGQHLDWLLLAADQPVSRGPFGILEPAGTPVGRGSAPLAACTALFLPGLAIDNRGYRLGQGGGFYDRTLADVAVHDRGGPLRVAIVFEGEILPRVPTDDHDCRVDLALTEVGIHHFPGTP